MHAETRLRNHGIRLLITRHFHCLHKFKAVHMRVCINMSNTHMEKLLIDWRFRAQVKYPASGNTFMEIVTDKCPRTTFLLTEACTWKAGLKPGRFTFPQSVYYFQSALLVWVMKWLNHQVLQLPSQHMPTTHNSYWNTAVDRPSHALVKGMP